MPPKELIKIDPKITQQDQKGARGASSHDVMNECGFTLTPIPEYIANAKQFGEWFRKAFDTSLENLRKYNKSNDRKYKITFRFVDKNGNQCKTDNTSINMANGHFATFFPCDSKHPGYGGYAINKEYLYQNMETVVLNLMKKGFQLPGQKARTSSRISSATATQHTPVIDLTHDSENEAEKPLDLTTNGSRKRTNPYPQKSINMANGHFATFFPCDSKHPGYGGYAINKEYLYQNMETVVLNLMKKGFQLPGQQACVSSTLSSATATQHTPVIDLTHDSENEAEKPLDLTTNGSRKRTNPYPQKSNDGLPDLSEAKRTKNDDEFDKSSQNLSKNASAFMMDNLLK